MLMGSFLRRDKHTQKVLEIWMNKLVFASKGDSLATVAVSVCVCDRLCDRMNLLRRSSFFEPLAHFLFSTNADETKLLIRLRFSSVTKLILSCLVTNSDLGAHLLQSSTRR